MRLRWSGKLDGGDVDGVVDAGACYGPVSVTSMVEALVSRGVRVGLGSRDGAASLSDPLLARETLRAVLDPGSALFEGDPVPEDPVPADVVA